MELLTLVLVPLLIEPLTQWLKKERKDRNAIWHDPRFIAAVFSVIGGTAFAVWQFAIPDGWKEWALVAYPIFLGGAIATHKFIRPFLSDE
jgi:hypothetical protein